MSLSQIADYIADSVATRAANGMNFGVAIIPEGVVEFVPEFSVLIQEINELLAGSKADEFNALPTWADEVCIHRERPDQGVHGLYSQSFRRAIQQQLFLERDPHGNVQVSLIESEKLFSALVKDKLEAKKSSWYIQRQVQRRFIISLDTKEDAHSRPTSTLTTAILLGYNAFMLIQYGYTGYLSKVSNLSAPANEWVAGGMPITKMMNMERRHGEDKPVIKKALVELDGAPFKFFESHREEWAKDTCFVYPGAIQYYGPTEVCDITTITLALEQQK